jgi:hypothetical protein
MRVLTSFYHSSFAFAAGVNLDVEQVALHTHNTMSGVDFYTINPKGNVPALILPDGTLFIEGVTILQYIADMVNNIVSISIVSNVIHGNLSRHQYRPLEKSPHSMAQKNIFWCSNA